MQKILEIAKKNIYVHYKDMTSIKNNISFKSNPIINATSFIEDRILLNKALLDGTTDVSVVLNTNNKYERNERIRRFAVAWGVAFLTPLITLPLTNRLAMKYVAKLTPKLSSKNSNLIELSNKFLKDKCAIKEGIEKLSKDKKTDYSDIIKKCDGDYEKLRRKLVDAKMSVLSFDFLFTSATLGSIGFINRFITRKKTGRSGFSAEFNMADKASVEQRAEKYKKTEKLRNAIFIPSVILLGLLPLIIRKGLNSKGKTADFIKKYADKFDYNDGIFMKRLPFLLMTLVADIGIILSSRNKTEVKDNAVRLSASQAAFFGGDIIIGSTLAVLSDRIFKTQLLDKECNKNWINKIIPPIKPIRNLKGKDKAIAAGLFWVNMCALFTIMGVGIPKMLNKMIKKDVDKDVKSSKT